MMVQLMIMYFVVFSSSRHEVAVATLAFGINSGAYVAEIVRGGIMSVDAGQMEAGRSLGMNYTQIHAPHHYPTGNQKYFAGTGK